MKHLQDILPALIRQPKPADLVALQGALLALGQECEAVERSLEIAGHFHTYLCELQSKLTARDFSDLASRLDIGAVGFVALESTMASEREDFWGRLLLGGIGESLMIAASRQYIKAWEAETAQVHAHAAWYLTGAVWRASCEMQAELAPEQRWQIVHLLLAPAHDQQVPAPQKALLLGRVFQMLLITYLARLLPAAGTGE